jgi:hypothetical protein
MNPNGVTIDEGDEIVWRRSEKGADDLEVELTSVMQFESGTINLGKKRTLRKALFIDEYFGLLRSLKRVDDKYAISSNRIKQVRWCEAWIADKYVLVTGRKSNRSIAIKILNNGFKRSEQPFEGLILDTKRMSELESNQWSRSFQDRNERIERGIVYGDGVEKDSIFGKELKNSTARTVGFDVELYGEDRKALVSATGSFTIYKDVIVDEYIKLFEEKILYYRLRKAA